MASRKERTSRRKNKKVLEALGLLRQSDDRNSITQTLSDRTANQTKTPFSQFLQINLYTLVEFIPFVVGLIVGIRQFDFYPTSRFYLITSYFLILFTLRIQVVKRSGLNRKIKRSLLVIVPLILGALMIQSLQYNEQHLTIILLSTTTILFLAKDILEINSMRQILIFLIVQGVAMAASVTLGIYAAGGEVLELRYAIFGLVPASILGSAKVASISRALEASGIKRNKLIVKSGKEKLVPAGSSKLFASLLIIGPAVPFALASMRVIPERFLLVALVLVLTPNLATHYLEKTLSDEEISFSAQKLAAISNIIILIIALL